MANTVNFEQSFVKAYTVSKCPILLKPTLLLFSKLRLNCSSKAIHKHFRCVIWLSI